MAGMESGSGHLLSLKVMRVSRPALASAWEPFYSSSPSFSAHSTASILSLQGKTPLDGHPKTLRDLTHSSELLTLPSSFGSIQLGETFSSCLCVNNETTTDIEAVSMKVEMQTVTSKVVLAEYGGASHRLLAGDTLENVVHHEIKELGQHVLACTVSYRLPPSHRHAAAIPEDGSDPSVQSFRKFYKFAVTNPLSVKTKVHTPRSPSALMSLAERDKVFLEIHIQNLTPEPLWFESMRFECADGWIVQDVTNINNGDVLFSGSNALMQSQDMRQYIYILTPAITNLESTVHGPGAIIALGRLDLWWRSSYGEPARLLTSTLSRRVPLLSAVQNPASALPPHLKRGSTASTPPRPRSPQLPPSRPASPTIGLRPSSPFRNRPVSSAPGASRPQSPPLVDNSFPAGLDVNLIIHEIAPDDLVVQKPFKVVCTLTVSASFLPDRAFQRRLVTLAIQHMQAPRRAPQQQPNPPELVANSRLPSSPGFSSPSPTYTTFNYALAYQNPRQRSLDEINLAEVKTDASLLPPPVSEKLPSQSNVVFSGASAIVLPLIELSPQPDARGKLVATQKFELSYVPLRAGFTVIGGLRAVLLDDRYVDNGEEEVHLKGHQKASQILKEWDVIGEIWVPSA